MIKERYVLQINWQSKYELYANNLILMLEANPHVQTTARVWPNNQNLKEYLSLPLALSLQPFIHNQPEGSIGADDINLYRCQSCKAFINQLCFIRNDHEYDCSICGCTNYVNQIINISMVELNNLSYKLKAPQKQRILTTPERLLVFVLDLSDYGEQTKQYLLYSIHVIKQFIKTAVSNRIPLNIMIIPFDLGIHSYSYNRDDATLSKIITNTAQDTDQGYSPNYNLTKFNLLNQTSLIYKILASIQEDTVKGRLRPGQSKAILQAIKLSFKGSEGYSGKIFLVSGLRNELKQFFQSLIKYSLDLSQRHNFLVNKRQCIPQQIQKLIQSTQMSLSISFINNHYMNNMPFHCMTKQLNGQLRHYFSNQLLLFFQDFRKNLQHLLSDNTVYESLMRVRYSTGLKLVGIFGAFRQTKVGDQIQLLTCPFNRRLLYQFIVEGRITNQFVVVQFSSLYTDWKGERYFLIQTHVNRVSENIQIIIPSIEYSNVNISYVRGIIHNLDSASKLRNLQLILQQRCKKHIRAIKELIKRINPNIHPQIPSIRAQVVEDSQFFKTAKPYIIITFLMMKHFLLNQIYPNAINFDLNAQIRSKVATVDDSVNIIWPIIYAVTENGWQVIQMKEKYLSKATVAIFIDRCDQHYVYLVDSSLQNQTKTANGKQALYRLIETDESLQMLKQLIEEFKQKKNATYIDMLPLQQLSELKILDISGQFGFQKFINELINA